jgi:amino acid adenylation domain-containing protein
MRTAVTTHAQRAIWTLQRMTPSLEVFRGGYAATAEGPLDPQVLARAVEGLVERHETLRTTFAASAGEVRQCVQESGIVPIDWDETFNGSDEDLLHRLVTELRLPFDLERGPLVRLFVHPRADGTHVLLIAAHHSIGDLLSLRLLMEELEERYRALSEGRDPEIAALPRQFRDHAEWQAAMLESDEGEKHERYWRERLGEGGGVSLSMPLDHSRPSVEVHSGSTHLFEIPREVVVALERIAGNGGATLYAALVAAWGVLLHRYSGQESIVVGSYSSGRVRRDLREIFGPMSNPIPLRLQIGSGCSFIDLVRQVGRSVRGALRHQFFPLSMMTERLGIPRDRSRSPVFQAAINLDRDEPLRLEDRTWRHEPWIPLLLRNQEGQFELRLMTCLRQDGSISAGLQYQTSLYERETIERMAGAWLVLLQQAARHPENDVAALRMLDPVEEDIILRKWNATGRPFPEDSGIHELVRKQIARTPKAVAVVDGEGSLTYAALGRRVSSLAERLRDAGAGENAIVGICLEPSISQVVALLAILETGAAYLPLDPSHPLQRRQSMLDDAGASLLVGDETTLEGLAAPRTFVLQGHVDRATVPFRPAPGGGRRAYVLFTSGSTGRPKGVEISHRSVVNLLTSIQERVGIGPGHTWLAITTLSFDIAALEVFLPLITGARLVMASRDVAGSGSRLAGEIERHGATIVQATPTSWRLLQASSPRSSRPVIRLCGGEPLSRALADQLLRDPGPLWNVYGPTETTIWSTASLHHPDEKAPAIGRPLANTQVYVLDPLMQPVPAGVVGELWIGGEGVALGYLGRPELTAERFLPDPFRAVPGARIYRTGDLARWRPCGELECLGRVDDQVKIRGIRIELGEIESVLLAQPSVAQAAVVARAGDGGDSRLVAYVVPAGGEALDVAAIRQTLRLHLPDYMVPASFTILPALPLTPNLKVDRKSLPEASPEPIAEATFVPPQTAIEREIAELFEEVLKLDRVGVDDDFFDLGGASIASLEISAKGEERGLDFDPEAVFEHRTVRALAAMIESRPIRAAGAGT